MSVDSPVGAYDDMIEDWKRRAKKGDIRAIGLLRVFGQLSQEPQEKTPERPHHIDQHRPNHTA